MDDDVRPRDRVLGVAMDIIVEKGMDKLRLAEIARRTNMSSGHVLYYFGTKDRILTETLVWSEQQTARRRQEAIEAAAPGWPQLRVYVDWYLPRDHTSPTWALWVEMWARRHAINHSSDLQQVDAADAATLAAILERGVATGAFGTVPETFSRRLHALMTGMAVYVLEKTMTVDEARETVLEQCRLELTPPGVALARLAEALPLA
jgi:AcrR family transcriptional regulator